ncbi:MAG: hypothetical protein RMI91_08020 [Gemmatales bacterium]|nr:hypothetical protein [Gemmatales bacterium]MDW7994587.1 hypothetical protein [Gemmatales bacterium]
MQTRAQSLVWPWVVFLMSLAFALAWPQWRPTTMSVESWMPSLWIAGLVWLAWKVKNWLLGVLTGLVAIFHPETVGKDFQAALGEQLTGLVLLAAWCAQVVELVWHPSAGWRSWLAWTLVGCVLAIVMRWHDAVTFSFAQTLLWSCCLSVSGLVLWYGGEQKWNRCAYAWCSVVAVAACVTLCYWVWPSQTGSGWPFSTWADVRHTWNQALGKFLNLPLSWLERWALTLLLVWAWWRTLRRAWRCAQLGMAPSSLVLTWAAPLLVVRILLAPSQHVGLFIPIGMLLLGYLSFDLLHGMFERMRLEPPDVEAPAGPAK